MSAPASGETSNHHNTVCEQNESGNPTSKNEERRNWNVGNNWGFSLEAIFGFALKFFKEMNGKAFNPTYEENLLFIALQKQIFLGPYNPKLCPEVGFFDVLGNDRRNKWAELGSTAKEDAMEDFVKLLDSCCSLFSPYVTSHKIEKEEHERKLREEEERLRMEREEEKERREEEKRRQEADRLLSNLQMQQVEAALNTPNPVHFQENPQSSKCSDQQQRLIHRSCECILQAHHTHQVKQHDTAESPSPDSSDTASVTHPINQPESAQRTTSETTPRCHLFVESMPGEMPILAPSMWTMPQVNEFKMRTQQEAESVITVGRGEVLTVHIPTHDHGSTFFWEFATDYYDIAFGLYFEWPNTTNGVESVSKNQDAGQTEKANGKEEKTPTDVGPRISEVVPLFRRDSHENVYAGSHRYPSEEFIYSDSTILIRSGGQRLCITESTTPVRFIKRHT
ncbi:Golgi resident protein GCP60 [Silurus meridionalis]|uniref:ACB domain-containing protein n=1 Tax=Silurus meridionalis TaxID=175797 RepID=A0A8T0BAQ3_SILME|nr:Golgi resident protein GCP60 [Silurus meridionalis]KAF7704105.1 hypothetical protein HF521_021177 [Silurus meridionalis]